MTLCKIINKKNLVILGLNSGTSTDSLDMATVKLSSVGKNNLRIRFLAGKEAVYSRSLKELILKLADARTIELDELIYLDNLLGTYYAKKAAAFIKELKKKKITVDVIASHGQTVRHLPRKVKRLNYMVNGSLQLGSADFIAAVTGKVVVSDFRQADVALGNEGAPVTVAVMHMLFASSTASMLIVNIGGMSNYFYFPPKNSRFEISAGDCGPGNSLCDILSRKLLNEKYDKNGQWASKGKISKRLLLLLLSHPFFKSNYTSTGREIFGDKMVKKMVDFGSRFHLDIEDLMATAVEFTVRSIIMKINPILQKDKKLSKLYLTGGGRNNIFMVNRIRHYLPDLDICSADELGINADFIEAASYAVMGEACLRSRPLRTVYGKGKYRRGKSAPVLGKITQPPQAIARGK